MNFDILEQIQTYCEKNFPESPLLRREESQIAQAQMPPSRTYIFRMTALPPETGQSQSQEFAKLKVHLDQLGFQASVGRGIIEQGGHHVQLSVKDKRAQLYANGQLVGFRLNPIGPPTQFRVKSCTWDAQTKEFIYQITSSDGSSGARTVSENHLLKI